MDRMCPYIEKKTIQKVILQYNDDMQEIGSMQIYEREMMNCNEKCMKYENGKCNYKE